MVRTDGSRDSYEPPNGTESPPTESLIRAISDSCCIVSEVLCLSPAKADRGRASFVDAANLLRFRPESRREMFGDARDAISHLARSSWKISSQLECGGSALCSAATPDGALWLRKFHVSWHDLGLLILDKHITLLGPLFDADDSFFRELTEPSESVVGCMSLHQWLSAGLFDPHPFVPVEPLRWSFEEENDHEWMMALESDHSIAIPCGLSDFLRDFQEQHSSLCLQIRKESLRVSAKTKSTLSEVSGTKGSSIQTVTLDDQPCRGPRVEAVLQALQEHAPERLTTSDLSRKTGYRGGSFKQLLAAMVKHGQITNDRALGGYGLSGI